MLVTWFFIVFLTTVTILIHLEGLWLVRRLARLPEDWPRLGVLGVVATCLFLHVLEITFYAGGFMIADKFFQVGQFNDEKDLDTMAYFYYSAITFTAVGYGDILPSGDIRLLAVAESLNGLLMIGWSGAYTFIAMQKLWSDRALRRRDARRRAREAAPGEPGPAPAERRRGARPENGGAKRPQARPQAAKQMATAGDMPAKR